MKIKGIILLAGLALAADCLAQYEYQGQFGGSGSSAGKFSAPRGVAVDLDGRIVITESGNHRFQICDPDGTDCVARGGFGTDSGEFDRPRGVAVNSIGKIFIADRGNDRIQNCSATGVCVAFGNSGTAAGQFDSPRGVTVNLDNRIIVADTDNDRIQVCTSNGLCSAFGSTGGTLGRFRSPAGVGVMSDGRIAIADRGNNRIQLCTEAGDCTAFGGPGTAAGQFDTPAGVAVDSRDRIVVVDRFNHRVQVCGEFGSCTAFGSFGSGNGRFDLPWGVAVDSEDRIFVADLGNDRVQVFVEPAAPEFAIHAGLNDAWVSAEAPLQGFFFTVFEQLGFFFLSWFTFDSEPPGGVAAFGASDQRWVTASGAYSGNTAVLSVELTSGGAFNAADPVAAQQPGYGTITIEFTGCDEAMLAYQFPSAGLAGQMTMTRALPSNVALCEAGSGP